MRTFHLFHYRRRKNNKLYDNHTILLIKKRKRKEQQCVVSFSLSLSLSARFAFDSIIFFTSSGPVFQLYHVVFFFFI